MCKGLNSLRGIEANSHRIWYESECAKVYYSLLLLQSLALGNKKARNKLILMAILGYGGLQPPLPNNLYQQWRKVSKPFK